MIASVIGMTVGFIAGYRGGVVDEILSMLTNVVLVIPTLAVLIIVAAYLSVRGLVIEAILIGATAWPWAARAIRAQTFSLASREFVGLARLTGAAGRYGSSARDRAEHELLPFMMFILLFGGAILVARDARLPRPRPGERDVARPDDEQRRSGARCRSACGGGSSRPGSAIIGHRRRRSTS